MEAIYKTTIIEQIMFEKRRAKSLNKVLDRIKLNQEETEQFMRETEHTISTAHAMLRSFGKEADAVVCGIKVEFTTCEF